MPASSEQCAFCEIVRGERAARLVYEDPQLIAFLDTRPVFPGHTLLVPRPHYRTLADLPDSLLAPLLAAARLLSRAVPAAMGAEGTFVAANNVVSQSVPHLHVHVVPRTKGDGLRGFFWPRHAYADEHAADRVQQEVSAAVRALAEQGARGQG
jgi:histidine triad (HIT) family protein